MRVFESFDALTACAGQEIAVSDWLTVTQPQVDQFAEATGDHQWIHVDPERARAGPFGATIAHGFLTLSLLSRFLESAVRIAPVRMGLNYGLNRVRFTAPVPVGSRLRARIRIAGVEPLGEAGCQATWSIEIEREGADKSVCFAEFLTRHYS